MRGGLHSGDRGFILIAVLWLGLGISVVATYLLVSAQFLTRQAIASQDSAAEDVSALDAAAHWTVAALQTGDPTYFGGAEQTHRITREFGGRSVDIEVQETALLADLNSADVAQLAQMLQQAGIAQQEAEDLAARIVDFRDADSLRMVNGAERDDYAAAGLSGPRDGPFRSASDLGLVLGFPQDKLAAAMALSVALEAVDVTQQPEEIKLIGNRLNPVNGGRRIQVLDRPGFRVTIRVDDGPRSQFLLDIGGLRPAGGEEENR